MNELAPVVRVAIDRAVSLLVAARVEYAIRLPDGEVLGALPVVPPKPSKTTPSYRKQTRWSSVFPYIEEVRAMKPGDVVRYVLPPELVAREDAFHSSLCSAGGRFFGNKSCVSSKTITPDGKHVLELLRVV